MSGSKVHSFTPPVSSLLTYGHSDQRFEHGHIPDYCQEFGFTTEHIPELIELACLDLTNTDPESLEIWAPVHAWRTLGQLKAEASIEPLISLFANCEDDDWLIEEMPEVFGNIGSASIEPLANYLADPSHYYMAQVIASECLTEIAQNYPETRSQCVEVLTKQLGQFEQNDIALNSFLVSGLIELEAVESAPAIEKAFAADRIDCMMEGDWDEVQVSLGLKSRDQVPKKDFTPPELKEFLSLLDRNSEPKPFVTQTANLKKSNSSSKNKMAKKSRQKNRKKK